MNTVGELKHKSILLSELLAYLPQVTKGRILDVTAGGGGHFFNFLKVKPEWTGQCWDRDPAALQRLCDRSREEKIESKRWVFIQKEFAEAPSENGLWNFILADIGISSFQIDDPARGMSLFSQSPIDFRMNPEAGLSFWDWLKTQSLPDLEKIFETYGEEPRARKLAEAIKKLPQNSEMSANALAEFIAKVLSYGSKSRTHPATRAFQAFRIAINDELGQLKSFLSWAPLRLAEGGRLGVLSFHSLEDRMVKKTFRDLADSGAFDILNEKPVVPSAQEQEQNPRSRSAKLRILERKVVHAGLK